MKKAKLEKILASADFNKLIVNGTNSFKRDVNFVKMYVRNNLTNFAAMELIDALKKADFDNVELNERLQIIDIISDLLNELIEIDVTYDRNLEVTESKLRLVAMTSKWRTYELVHPNINATDCKILQHENITNIRIVTGDKLIADVKIKFT